MWKDSKKARFERYLACLKENPDLYQPLQDLMQAGEKQSICTAELFDREQQDAFEMVNTYVLAPALNAYVLWVLKEAMASGKKRLYFLARDGYLMYRTAQVYCRTFQLPVECCYLCCSRYSIRIPMFHMDMEEAMDYICRGGIDVTMKKILNRAGLTSREQSEILDQIGMKDRQDVIIPYAQIPDIRKKLEACESFGQSVVRHSKEALPDLAGYLKQEGLTDDVPYALVDSGWVGSMQKVLGRMIGSLCGKEIRLEGYYWGLYELPEGVRAEDYHCYYFSPGSNMREKVYFSNCLFEGVFSAPHGMTLRYRNEDGYYRPVYADITEEHRKFMNGIEELILLYTGKKAAVLQTQMGKTQTGAKEYRSLEEYLSQMDIEQNHQTTHKLLRTFMGEPTKKEAEVFGRLQFSDDVLEESGQEIAAPLSQQELADNHVGNKILTMLGIKKGHVKESAWYEGSAVRGGRDVEKHLRRYAGYKYLLYLRKKRIWSKRKDG